jgi:site-specific DNA-methyltransferase (cytosine-N4-specific)
MIELTAEWQRYKMFPYERELGLKELVAKLKPSRIEAGPEEIRVATSCSLEDARRLTYFSMVSDGTQEQRTYQALLESSAQNGDKGNRQATRYSVHGIHEYKGKFNPQVAHALLNLLKVPKNGSVLDPFCGSGTTLVECAHSQINGVGTDINPLAVFVATAKLDTLRVPLKELEASIARTSVSLPSQRRARNTPVGDERTAYLSQWFPSETLDEIETLRGKIEQEKSAKVRRILSVIASDLLRDFSLQEPLDLRIRRRKEPPAYQPFHVAYKDKADKFLERVTQGRKVMGAVGKSEVINCDSTNLLKQQGLPNFDAVICSPPYATALPYIDTQRLSLVWLDLVSPSRLASLQADLIGSREFGPAQRPNTIVRMKENSGLLPTQLHKWCASLQESLSDEDGFRRQAMPVLLYRYFENMRRVFCGMKLHLKRGAHVALVVGHNHTTLGGTRIDIDTPGMLGQLAEHTGYASIERMPLQAYQRYGMHQRNAVAKEEILFFRKR